MFLIDKQSKQAKPVAVKSFSDLNLSERHDLQEWIVNYPKILGENLLIIQKEFDGFPDTNERLDLLALDENGRLVVIENKTDDSGRDVVWQALKYVSYCATLTKSEICDIYQRYLGTTGVASERLSEFYNQDYESIRINPTDIDQRIMLVAAKFRKEVTSTVLWLLNHGVNISCIKVTPHTHNDNLFLDVEQVLPTKGIEEYQIRLAAKKHEETDSAKTEAVRYKRRLSFWEAALPILRGKTGIFMNVSPSKDNWLVGGSGYGGITFNPRIRMDGARAELGIDTGDKDRNKEIFNRLKVHADSSDKPILKKLNWNEIPDKRLCVISIHYNKYGLNDEEHWGEIIESLADNLAEMIKAFKPMLESIIKGFSESDN